MQQKKELPVFDFDDIRLIPKLGILESRAKADTSRKINSFRFELPIIPANMSTIIDVNLAKSLAENGYFYVMHRFGTLEQQFQNVLELDSVKNLSTGEKVPVSISFGVKQIDLDLINKIKAANIKIDFATLDIAHGHSVSAGEMVKTLRANFPETFIIAGNVCTVEGAKFLKDAGADAVKIGVGPGSVCTTKLQTGFGSAGWQASAIYQISKEVDAFIIADGGIKQRGDIAKALVCGADLVMIGGMFAGFQESPGKIVEDIEGRRFKEFFGSASYYQKGEKKHVEGKHSLVPLKGSIYGELEAIKEALQSSISYAGGIDLSIFKQTEFLKI